MSRPIIMLSWLCLSLLTDRIVAHSLVTTTKASPPEVNDRIMLAELRKVKQALEQLQNICQNSDQSFRGGSPLASMTLRDKVMALEYDIQDTKLELQATKTALKSVMDTYKINDTSGSTFVRWGRKTCTDTSQLVYSGVAGTSQHTHKGAAANRLCVTMKPKFDNTAKPQYYAFLYGVEYEHIPSHHDHDVPCSVCLVPRSTTIMVPGTTACPNGWNVQYTGHLVAGHTSHVAASEYLCLDGNPEDAAGGHQNLDGGLLYYTTVQCGSLPCPPYIKDKIVLCVVCSS